MNNTNIVNGERKQRDHTKTGKLAKRKENRRLEAMARQARRIQSIESVVEGGKKPTSDIAEYILTFKNVNDALVHAKLTLQNLRGGIPHSQLVFKETNVVVATPKPVEGVQKTKKETTSKKPKSKYSQKKKKS